jgi:hypothetical protein
VGCGLAGRTALPVRVAVSGGCRVDAVVAVGVAEIGADAERLEDLAGVLGVEILAAGLGTVSVARAGDPPPGSRAVDVAAVGGLLVSVSGSVDAVRHLVGVVRAWLSRSPAERSVELAVGGTRLRVSNASADQQERLIEEFIRAVARD